MTTLTVRLDLTWMASILPGLLQLQPEDQPDLFGSLDRSRRRLPVIDKAIDARYGDKIRALLARCHVEHPKPLVIPGGEAAKTQATVTRIHQGMEAWGVPRFGERLLIWGGGAHDVGRYAPATCRRGVPYVAFATTLVSTVDAMFALKVAVSDLYNNRLGDRMRAGLRQIAPDCDVPAVVTGYGSIYNLLFTTPHRGRSPTSSRWAIRCSSPTATRWSGAESWRCRYR